MNFSKQLKKYRELNKLSQEALAEKIYVTRQTISKWENDKTYPDLQNLIALSILFDISLDELVKGDMDKMKKMINHDDMYKDTKGMLLFLVLMLIIGAPSVIIWGKWGFIPLVFLWVISMYFAFRAEKFKKQHDIKTYKEIVAFSEGNSNLDELREQRDQKKYLKEKTLIVLLFALVMGMLALIIGLTTVFLMNFF
ncbi:helix-turn-helix domain-containing protein [Vagococcus elongatus]|uniref:Transcriptional regulator n=1 Tax=Vagococcus elongatus TaxID=180344 RepID=A0A430AMC3_9ENTE|nr:helix-turn-helix transcriptional regulator [Vagococcus elongatus]RSU09268.1 transcriptional regulator [Vagococcus elongatus]